MPDTKEALRTMLRDVLGPLLTSDGGELYLVSVEKKEIRMHVAGTFSGSPAIDVLVRRIIEPAVKAISPKAKVVVSSGFRIPPGAERF